MLAASSNIMLHGDFHFKVILRKNCINSVISRGAWMTQLHDLRTKSIFLFQSMFTLFFNKNPPEEPFYHAIEKKV